MGPVTDPLGVTCVAGEPVLIELLSGVFPVGETGKITPPTLLAVWGRLSQSALPQFPWLHGGDNPITYFTWR